MACIRWYDCFVVVFCIVASSGDVSGLCCSSSGGGFLAKVMSDQVQYKPTARELSVYVIISRASEVR